uniref:Pentatricopeptide repeat-containing protein n=1 Tax=Kalanchoe fedtschenkoi TaxID=63787 RepID=A0A7N0VJU3_KALFE
MSCRFGSGVSIFEIIERMFYNKERVDMAIWVWSEMKARRVILGIHMHSILINTLFHLNKLDDVNNVSWRCWVLGLRSLDQMYSNMEQALLNADREDTTLMLSRKLEKLKKSQSLC